MHAFRHYRVTLWTEKIYNISNILSCTFGWLLIRGGREADQESKKKRREKDSQVSGNVVHSTLPVSVCLPERHSPTVQRSRATRGWKKEMKKKWKKVGHQGEPQHNPRGNSGKREKQDRRVRSRSIETNVEMFVKKQEAAWDHPEKSISERRRRRLKNCRVSLETRREKHLYPETHKHSHCKN